MGRASFGIKQDSNVFDLILRSIHQFFRSTNKDYFRSGFDRGHLAAAGNHWVTQESKDETFLLSNISPQVDIYGFGTASLVSNIFWEL